MNVPIQEHYWTIECMFAEKVDDWDEYIKLDGTPYRLLSRTQTALIAAQLAKYNSKKDIKAFRVVEVSVTTSFTTHETFQTE